MTDASPRKNFAGHFDSGVSGSRLAAVAAIQLMTLLTSGGRALIKIDVDGFEAELLEALIPLINWYDPDLIIDLLPETESDIASWASKTGYSSALLMDDAPVQQGPIIVNLVYRD